MSDKKLQKQIQELKEKAKAAKKPEIGDNGSLGNFNSYKEHTDKAHYVFALAIFTLGVIMLNGFFAIDAKIEHKMDYLNQRIDHLRVEFSAPKKG